MVAKVSALGITSIRETDYNVDGDFQGRLCLAFASYECIMQSNLKTNRSIWKTLQEYKNEFQNNKAVQLWDPIYYINVF